VDTQVPKVPALLVHVETADSVGVGVASAAVDAAVVVPVGAALALAAEAEDREAACAASVGPKPKQAVSMDNVADYKSSVLPYETCSSDMPYSYDNISKGGCRGVCDLIDFCV